MQLNSAAGKKAAKDVALDEEHDAFEWLDAKEVKKTPALAAGCAAVFERRTNCS